MVKDKIAYVCSNCGFDSAKWIGKCPSCGEWNTFKEFRLGRNSKKTTSRTTIASSTHHLANQDNKPLRLNEISGTEAPRINMNDGELNRVLGGGLVRGSITLLGGEPGIGKSTLTMQTLLSLSHLKVLYVSGEESAYQLKMRAERLSKGLKDTSIDHNNLIILCEMSLETIIEQIIDIQPELIIIDSIQTISTEQVESSPGSITQVRECSSQLLRFAKTTNTPVLLIGHINKEGTFAGPKVLEHIVDTVIMFEGDQHHVYRILRATKNRFGSTSELGIYEMRDTGLRQVDNPSELLLSQDLSGLSGVAISCAIEGARPLMLETQALVSTAAYGTPQRSATGLNNVDSICY